MCLGTVWPEEKTKEWLKNRPDTITAYKVVKVRRDKVEPPFLLLNGHIKKRIK